MPVGLEAARISSTLAVAQLGTPIWSCLGVVAPLSLFRFVR